jgi:hypothetical protein
MLFQTIFIILIGLFILDIAPIHQQMICDSVSEYNATSCPEETYFSQTYFDARRKFRAAAASAGATVTPHVIVEEDGVEYTLDAAVVKGSERELVIVLSGVHGAEGFIGSAIQTKILSEWNATRAGPTALFLHAVNPYGFAKLRRFNEHNVDLNRNFFLTDKDRAEAVNRDPNIAGFETFRDLLVPSRIPTLFERYFFLLRGAYYLARYGYGTLKKAMVSGQYHCPEGPYYGGGITEEKSVTVVKSILSQYKAFTKVVSIDIHSGLGPEGIETILVPRPADKEGVIAIFGDGAKPEMPGDGAVSAGYEVMLGGFDLRPLFGDNAQFVDFTMEFGTIPGIFVSRAVLMENAAYHLARNSYIHHVTAEWLRDAFYPQKISAKKSYLSRGVKAFDASWKYLGGKVGDAGEQ